MKSDEFKKLGIYFRDLVYDGPVFGDTTQKNPKKVRKKHLDPSSILTFPKQFSTIPSTPIASHLPSNIPPDPTKNTDRPTSLTWAVFKTLTRFHYWLDKDPYKPDIKKSPKTGSWLVVHPLKKKKSPGFWSLLKNGSLIFWEHLGALSAWVSTSWLLWSTTCTAASKDPCMEVNAIDIWTCSPQHRDGMFCWPTEWMESRTANDQVPIRSGTGPSVFWEVVYPMTYRGFQHSFYNLYMFFSHEAIFLWAVEATRKLGNRSLRKPGLNLSTTKWPNLTSQTLKKKTSINETTPPPPSLLILWFHPGGWFFFRKFLVSLCPPIGWIFFHSSNTKALVAWISFSLTWLQSPRNVATISRKTSTCRLLQNRSKATPLFWPPKKSIVVDGWVSTTTWVV